MARKISRDKALAAAILEVLGTGNNGMYSLRNIRGMLEVDLPAALEKRGYVIVDADTAWTGAEKSLAEQVEP